MCDVPPPHDGPPPPPGEAWCIVRLGIEWYRYETGWPFEAQIMPADKIAKDLGLTPTDDPDRL